MSRFGAGLWVVLVGIAAAALGCGGLAQGQTRPAASAESGAPPAFPGMLLPPAGTPGATTQSSPGDFVRVRLSTTRATSGPAKRPTRDVSGVRLTFAPGGDAPFFAIAPDGRQGDARGAVISALDPLHSKVFYEFAFEGMRFRGVTASADGRHVLVYGSVDAKGSRTGQRPLYAVFNPRVSKKPQAFGDSGEYAPQLACISGDGQHVLAYVSGTKLELWDVTTGQLMRTVDSGGGVGSLRLSRDGSVALVGGVFNDEDVDVIDLALNQTKLKLKGHVGPVTSVSFSPDERQALSSSLDGTARLWDLTDGTQLLAMGEAGTSIVSAAFAPDGAHAATADVGAPGPLPEWGMRSTIRYWDLKTGAELARWQGPSSSLVNLSFADKQTHLFVTGGGRDFSVYSLGSVAASAPATGPATKPGDLITRAQLHQFATEVPQCVRFVDGRTVYAATARNMVERLDVVAGRSLGPQQPVALQQWPECRGISADGKYAISCSIGHVGRELWLWEIASGLELHKVQTKGEISAAAITDDGAYVAIATRLPGEQEADLSVVGRVQRQEVAGIKAGRLRPVDLRFAPDSSSLAIMSVASPFAPGQVQVWDLKSGDLRMLPVSGMEAGAMAYSADSKLLVCAFADNVTVFDLKANRLVKRWTVPGRPLSVAVSPDGKRVLTGGDDSNVRVYDVQTGVQLALLQDHLSAVTAVAFSPDGKLAASGSRDRSVRVWGLER